MRVAVLMTCHNRRGKTLACLSALFEQELPSGTCLSVYLVDDGSTDATGMTVAQKFPDVHVLQGDGSLYWCGGMRMAWAEAMRCDFDGYLWLNDDTILLSGAIRTLINTLETVRLQEGCDGIVVGSCCDLEKGVHTYGGRVKRSHRSRLANQPLLPEGRVLPCDTMNGNLVLVSREVFNILGNLSLEYSHTFGDVDYGMRAKQHGISVWVAPQHLARCDSNTKARLWIDPCVSLKTRWADMKKPTGLPPKEWYVYVKRHTGVLWPIYFIKPIIRLLMPILWLRFKTK